MGEKAFTNVQAGLEAIHGTAVAATRKYLFKVDPGEDRKIHFPELPLGIRARTHKAETRQISADGINITTPEGCYFQALPMLFSIGLKGGVTAVEQTLSQSDYLWDFTPDLEDDNDPDSITLEYGDDVQGYEIPYIMARRYVIEGNVGEDANVSVTAECFGEQITPIILTPSLSNPTIEGMVANMAKLYIDSTWATLGTTQKKGLLRKYRIEIITGVHQKFWAEGVKTMTGHAESFIDAMWSLTFEGNSDADVLFDAFQAMTAKAMRLEIIGAQIGTGKNHTLTIDTYGKFEKVLPLDDEKDGNNLHTAIFTAISDNEATPHMLGVQVITDVAAINP